MCSLPTKKCLTKVAGCGIMEKQPVCQRSARKPADDKKPVVRLSLTNPGFLVEGGWELTAPRWSHFSAPYCSRPVGAPSVHGTLDSVLTRRVSHFVSLTFYTYYTTDHWVCQGFFKIFLAIFPLWREGCHPNELLFSDLHSRSSHVFFYKVIRNSLVFYFIEDFLTPSSLSYILIIACFT